MHPVLSEILQEGPVVTDGAWGTQLQMSGLEPGDFPDAWNLEFPDKVAAVAESYASAGSQIVLTNTFGANRIRLLEASLETQAVAINQKGAELSKTAVGDRAKVFGSIGPSGKMLCVGEVTAESLSEAFLEQAMALAEGGADGLVIETMSDPEEARLAVHAAKQTQLPVVACMVYDSGKALDRTMMGTTPEKSVEVLIEAGADVIGANCGQGIEGFLPLCKRMKAVCHLPIWIKANAGLPELIEGESVYKTTPEEFIAWVDPLINEGADFIGGCCGTSQDFIRSVAEALRLRKL
ncbi:MAG: methionine synthase [Verrucomicrobia bacterium]|jgi:5-methyltetrahydrofolate--homocysteine methyltransferase|nr:methionine synthase [Verrucomicrobiota bacterium]